MVYFSFGFSYLREFSEDEVKGLAPVTLFEVQRIQQPKPVYTCTLNGPNYCPFE